MGGSRGREINGEGSRAEAGVVCTMVPSEQLVKGWECGRITRRFFPIGWRYSASTRRW